MLNLKFIKVNLPTPICLRSKFAKNTYMTYMTWSQSTIFWLPKIDYQKLDIYKIRFCCWEPNRIRYFTLLQGNKKFWFVWFLLSFLFVVSANIFAFCFVLFCFFLRCKSYVMYCNVIYLHNINSRSSPEIEDYVGFFIPTLHF